MTTAKFAILSENRGHLDIKKGTFPDLDAAIRMANRIAKGMPNAGVTLHATTVAEGMVGYYTQRF